MAQPTKPIRRRSVLQKGCPPGASIVEACTLIARWKDTAVEPSAKQPHYWGFPGMNLAFETPALREFVSDLSMADSQRYHDHPDK